MNGRTFINRVREIIGHGNISFESLRQYIRHDSGERYTTNGIVQIWNRDTISTRLIDSTARWLGVSPSRLLGAPENVGASTTFASETDKLDKEIARLMKSKERALLDFKETMARLNKVTDLYLETEDGKALMDKDTTKKLKALF